MITETIKMSAHFCVEFIKATIGLGNKSVGEVTVLHMPPSVIIMALNLALKVSDGGATLQFAKLLWRAMFPGFVEKQGVAYVPQCVEEADPETGLMVAHVSEDNMCNTMDQVKAGFELSIDSLRAVCADFVAYGRAHQERTIDAAKNFFQVVIAWAKNFKGVKLLSRLRSEADFNLSINWTEEDTAKAKAKKMRIIAHSSETIAEMESGNKDSTVAIVSQSQSRFKKIGKKSVFFAHDYFNRFSCSLLEMVAQFAEKLSRLNPTEIESTVSKLEEMYDSSRKAGIAGNTDAARFALCCDAALFYRFNFHRSLTTAMNAEIKTARALYSEDADECKAQVKAIRKKYGVAYRELGAQVKRTVKSISEKCHKAYSETVLMNALIWASYRGERMNNGRYGRVASNKASNFADNICPDEFAKYMLTLAGKKGYAIPEYTEDVLEHVPSVLKETVGIFENDYVANFVLGVASTEYGDIIARENLEGDFIIRKDERGAIVASQRLEDAIEVEEIDDSRLTFMLSMNDVSREFFDEFVKNAVKDAEVTLADYAFEKNSNKRYKNAIVIDGKIYGTARAMSEKHEKMRDLLSCIYGDKCGKLDIMRLTSVESNGKKYPVAIVTLKDVHKKTLKSRNFELAVSKTVGEKKPVNLTGDKEAKRASVMDMLRRR